MSMIPGQLPGEERKTEGWRLLIAVAVISVLWFVWPYIFPEPEQPPAPAAASQPQGQQPDQPQLAQAASQTAPVLAPTSAPSSASGVPSHVAADQPTVNKPTEAFVDIESELYGARLSTWGAAITDFRLVEYEDEIKRAEGHKAPPVDLVPGKGVEDRSFSLRAIAGTFPLPPDAAYQLVEQSGQKVVLRHDTGRGVLVTRTYVFSKGGYAFEVETGLQNTTDAVQSVTLEMAVTGQERADEREGGSFFQPATDQMSWSCRTSELHQDASQSHEKDESFRGTVNWAGINRQYFLAAVVPRQGQTAACHTKRLAGNGMRVAVEYAPVTIPAGQTVVLKTTGYFGPKQLSRLEQLEATVDEAVDFGWFGVISRPLLWLLVFFYGYVKNYGIAILLLTFIVKLVLLPVTQKSFESAERMKRIQPLMKEVQAKYKHDRMMASQKQMELFKEHKVSPFGGCLPMALQMPIWIALYRTLWSSVELYQQPFVEGWVDNLAFKDPTYVLPIAVGVVMLVQQFFTPVPQDNPSMKYVMWGMPIFFMFIMISLPSGLALYIFANSLLTIFQQAYIRRKFTKAPAADGPPVEAAESQPKKKRKKKK